MNKQNNNSEKNNIDIEGFQETALKAIKSRLGRVSPTMKTKDNFEIRKHVYISSLGFLSGSVSFVDKPDEELLPQIPKLVNFFREFITRNPKLENSSLYGEIKLRNIKLQKEIKEENEFYEDIKYVCDKIESFYTLLELRIKEDNPSVQRLFIEKQGNEKGLQKILYEAYFNEKKYGENRDEIIKLLEMTNAEYLRMKLIRELKNNKIQNLQKETTENVKNIFEEAENKIFEESEKFIATINIDNIKDNIKDRTKKLLEMSEILKDEISKDFIDEIKILLAELEYIFSSKNPKLLKELKSLIGKIRKNKNPHAENLSKLLQERLDDFNS